MTALRLARGVTGRPKVIKFAGNYHGHGDALLAAGGSGVATLGLSGSAGVTEAAVSQTVVAPYNVVPALDDDVACVIVEPVAANMGLVAPGAGLPRGAAGGLRRGGRAPRLRRGDHRLPPRPRRRAGRVRRRARPHLLRQGHRRRPAHRRLRRSRRGDGVAGPARARVPGRHAVGEPARHGRRPRRARPARRRRSTPSSAAGRARLADGLPRGARARRTCRSRCPSSARWSACTSAPRPRSTTTPPARRTRRPTPASSTPSWTRAWPSPRAPTRSPFPGLAHDDSVLDEVIAAAADAARRRSLPRLTLPPAGSREPQSLRKVGGGRRSGATEVAALLSGCSRAGVGGRRRSAGASGARRARAAAAL